MDRNVNAAPNKKPFFVDYAIVVTRLATSLALVLWDFVKSKWPLCAEGWHTFVNFTAGNAFESERHRSNLRKKGLRNRLAASDFSETCIFSAIPSSCCLSTDITLPSFGCECSFSKVGQGLKSRAEGVCQPNKSEPDRLSLYSCGNGRPVRTERPGKVPPATVQEFLIPGASPKLSGSTASPVLGRARLRSDSVSQGAAQLAAAGIEWPERFAGIFFSVISPRKTVFRPWPGPSARPGSARPRPPGDRR